MSTATDRHQRGRTDFSRFDAALFAEPGARSTEPAFLRRLSRKNESAAVIAGAAHASEKSAGSAIAHMQGPSFKDAARNLEKEVPADAGFGRFRTAEKERLLRDRFEANVAAARLGGTPSSDYFLDKCGSEAGDTLEVREPGEQDLQRTQEPERTSSADTAHPTPNKTSTWIQSRFRDEQRARQTIAVFAVGGALVGLAVVLVGLWRS